MILYELPQQKHFDGQLHRLYFKSLNSCREQWGSAKRDFHASCKRCHFQKERGFFFGICFLGSGDGDASKHFQSFVCRLIVSYRLFWGNFCVKNFFHHIFKQTKSRRWQVLYLKSLEMCQKFCNNPHACCKKMKNDILLLKHVKNHFSTLWLYND